MAKNSQIKEDKVKRKKKKKHIGLKVFLVILIIIAVAGAFFAKRVYDLNGNWLAALMGHNKNTLQNLDRLTFLVMGESGGNTDTIIVCTYDPKTQDASMLSIPRDTFVGSNQKTARPTDKINSLYQDGTEPMKTVEAVNEITGLNIKDYILIDTEALKELVDIMGGLEFNVPIDMKYDDYSKGNTLHINLKAGYQKLTGDQVEQLTRFRHNNDGSTYPYEYGMEDFGRMKTQRAVIKAIASQIIKFKNVTEIGNILDVMKKNVKTNMDLSSFKDYIPYAMNINLDDVKAEQLPAEPKTLNGISFVIYDKAKTKTLINDMFHLNQTTTQEDNTNITNTSL